MFVIKCWIITAEIKTTIETLKEWESLLNEASEMVESLKDSLKDVSPVHEADHFKKIHYQRIKNMSTVPIAKSKQ